MLMSKFEFEAVSKNIFNWFRNKSNARKILKVVYSIFRFILLLALSYIVIYPLIYMLTSAFKPMDQAMDPSVVWVPKSLSFANFVEAFKLMDYPRSFLVSFFTLVIPGLVEVLTCAIAAYGFARFQFRERNFLFMLVLITIIVPPETMISSLYLQYANLDFFGILNLIGNIIGKNIRPSVIDTPFTFLLPSVFGAGLRSGLFIFIYRQFFKGLPRELEEAAYVDGAGPLRTFFRIVLPTAGPSILCVFLFSMIWHWNEYNLSTMFMVENTPLPFQVSQLKSMVIQNAPEYSIPVVLNILMAGCVLFLLPMLILYLVAQKYFIQSIDRVGLVG